MNQKLVGKYDEIKAEELELKSAECALIWFGSGRCPIRGKTSAHDRLRLRVSFMSTGERSSLLINKSTQFIRAPPELI
jgi:hypothetical protein